MTIREVIYSMNCKDKEFSSNWIYYWLEGINSRVHLLLYAHFIIYHDMKICALLLLLEKTVETVPTGLWGFNTFWFLNLKNCKLKSCIFNGYWFCNFSLVFRQINFFIISLFMSLLKNAYAQGLMAEFRTNIGIL